MIFRELNDDNYMLFAIRHYENPHSDTKDDFLDDLKRFKYVKRLLKRFKKTGVFNFWFRSNQKQYNPKII